VAALQMLVDLEKRGALSSSTGTDTARDSLGSFIRGEAALDTDGPWVQDIMNRYGAGSTTLEMGQQPVASPPLEPNPPATLVNMMMIGMWSGTRSPNAAWELLKFLRAEQADLAFIDGATGGLPVVNAAYVAAVRWPLVGKDAFRVAAQAAQTWPAVAQIDVVQAQIATAVSSALNEAKTPKRALDEAARAVAVALQPPKPKKKKAAPRKG
jgi:ABC-type glycerol-3-phosphate transport system substrate-binding protein